MSRLKEKIKSMDEKRFKNLYFTLNLIAYTSLITFIFSSSIIPYAIEIGSWLFSQNILDVVLVVSGIFFFTVSEYLKHIYNGNKRLLNYEKPLVNKSGKFYKFMKTGIVIVGCIILGATAYLYFGLKKNSVTNEDRIEKALIKEKELKALGCTLEGHELKYNSSLLPIIVSTAVKKDSVLYLTDEISEKKYSGPDENKKVEYKCANGQSLFSEFRFKRLMKKPI